jgi:hypothetical protein
MKWWITCANVAEIVKPDQGATRQRPYGEPSRVSTDL